MDRLCVFKRKTHIVDYDEIKHSDEQASNNFLDTEISNKVLRIGKKKSFLRVFSEPKIHAKVYFHSNESLEELAEKDVKYFKENHSFGVFNKRNTKKSVNVLIKSEPYKIL